MLRKITTTIVLLLSLFIATGIAIAAPTNKIFDERNVSIINAAPSNFTQQDLNSITPYIRAKIRFPEYSIQNNVIIPYGSITIKGNSELDKIAQDNNADILLMINMPTYEEYVVSWFGKDVWHVNVSADIYLYDTQTKKLQLKKIRSRDSGEYGTITSPNEVVIRALNQLLEKL